MTPEPCIAGPNWPSPEDWHARERTTLTPLERQFVEASVAAHLDERCVHRRRVRRRWVPAASAVILLGLTAVTGVVFIAQRQYAQAQQAVALSRELAARAMALSVTQPDIARLLALLAYRQAPTTEARNAVLTDQIPRQVASVAPAGRTVTAMAVSADGRAVATGYADGLTTVCAGVSLWAMADTTSGAILWFPDAPAGQQPSGPLYTVACPTTLWARDGIPVTAVALGDDGHILAVGHVDGTTSIWSPAAHHAITTLPAQPAGVVAVALTPDGHVVTVTNGTNAPTLCESLTMPQATPAAPRATACPDDLWSDAGDSPGDSHGSGPYSFVHAIAVSADGHTLAVGNSGGETSLWNLATRQITDVLLGQPPGSSALALGPDDHTLATADTDGTIRLWDIPSRGEIAAINMAASGLATTITGMTFSPDGHALLTVNTSGDVTFWDLDVDHVATRLCDSAAYLTPDQWARLIPELPFHPPCSQG